MAKESKYAKALRKLGGEATVEQIRAYMGEWPNTDRAHRSLKALIQSGVVERVGVATYRLIERRRRTSGSSMDVRKAAKETAKLIKRIDLSTHDPEYGKLHLLHMSDQVISGEVTGEKAHRWLGWIQACVCVGNGANLEELKEINHKVGG
jgi:hypothetical protein